HHWPQMMRLMAESPIVAMGNALDLVGLCALLVVLGVIPMVGFGAPACIRFSLPTSAGVAASNAVTPRDAKKPSHRPRRYIASNDG
ncbi:hypothetical protein ONJ45_25355, partial [Salmonella enterica subsp. enterica serovar Virginia]|nr:hypothetical protein [Salmonella enterica subsp. enterica serovar Virginia]